MRCRALMEMATELETIDQLRVWAVELADQAAKAGRRAVEENAGKAGAGNTRPHLHPNAGIGFCSMTGRYVVLSHAATAAAVDFRIPF